MRTKVYASYNKDNETRMRSSSGGLFTPLALYVFSHNGVVYGVAMTKDCYSSEYVVVTDEKGMEKLRGSKYFQANMGDTYKNIKADLNAGKMVLFTGTGCQINGLKNFLMSSKVNCSNLICVDVICHGVPSPALWKKYAKYQEEKYNGKLKWINFRCKDVSWTDFGIKEVISSISANKIKQIYISKDEDPFMQMFLRDYCLRPSCYACIAKKNKLSDITIADFWGINEIAPQMNDGKGTSLVIIRTKKGMDVFNKISEKLAIREVTYEDGVKENPAEYCSAEKPVLRDNFFDDMETMNFDDLSKKYIKLPVKAKIKKWIKHIIMPALRESGGEQGKAK